MVPNGPAGLFAFYTLRAPHRDWEWRALPSGWIHTGRGRTRDAEYQREESFSGPKETVEEAERAIAATLEEHRDHVARYRVSRTYDIAVG